MKVWFFIGMLRILLKTIEIKISFTLRRYCQAPIPAKENDTRRAYRSGILYTLKA
jgi:hypothetical protein